MGMEIKQSELLKEAISFDAPVVEDVDVLVCGGGPAGIAAAVAAVRQGASTLVIEKQGCLGGVATNCLVGVWLGSFSRDGQFPVIGGVFSDIVDRLVAEKAAIPASEDLVGGTRHVGYASWHGRTVPFEFEPCKRILEEFTLDAGVKLRYFTTVVCPQIQDRRIRGAFVHSKNGMEFIRTKTVVDATGDADIAFLSGCPTERGREEDSLTSPTGIIFVMEGVDSEAFENYCRETGDVRFKKVIGELQTKGQWPFPFGGLVCCEMPRRGRFFINALQQMNINGTKAEDLTRGIIEGRQQVRTLAEIMKKHIPGFAHSEVTHTSPVLGVRDTRRIIGEYRISVEDVIEGRHYPDTIGLSGYQFDMADPKNPTHQRMEKTKLSPLYTEIPYRSLLPKGMDNLIVAGRCVSSAWEALGVLRIMPACFVMGQAAGTAAAQVVRTTTAFRNVDIGLLQQDLLNAGVILGRKEPR
jgi:hypothetical protein